jgi:single-strand DNA-binding protein
MHSLNKAQIIGNLTRAPELKTTTGGQSVCSFGVATNRYWTDSSGQKRDEAEYHNVVAWGKLAEICAQYLHKGTKVFVEGRLQTRNWEDEAGTKHYRTEIVGSEMIILSPKTEGAPETLAAAAEDEPPAPKKTEEVSPEDLPF